MLDIRPGSGISKTILNGWFCILNLALMASNASAQDERVVDLTSTRGAEDVDSFLNRLGIGNEGSGGLRSLTYDRVSGVVRGTCFVRHRHVWVIDQWPLPPQHQTAWDSTWKGSFRFNARTGDGHAVFDVGRGAKLDTRRIFRQLKGDLEAYFQNVPNPITYKRYRDGYRDLVDQYGGKYGHANVYVSSKRLVNWASMETAGRWVSPIVASGGTITPAMKAKAMREASQKAQQELGDFLAWLKGRGIQEAEAIARDMLSGRRVEWPHLTLKWERVLYESRNYTEFSDRPIGPWIPSWHAAFVIIWRERENLTDSNPSSEPRSFWFTRFENTTANTIKFELRFSRDHDFKTYQIGPNEIRVLSKEAGHYLPGPQVRWDVLPSNRYESKEKVAIHDSIRLAGRRPLPKDWTAEQVNRFVIRRGRIECLDVNVGHPKH